MINPALMPLVVFGLMNATRKEGGFEVCGDQQLRIPIPRRCNKADLAKMRKDCEILQEMIDKRPKELSALLQQVSQGNLAEAEKTAANLGLSEEAFVKAGGGLLWLAIPIAVGILLAPRAAY